MTLKQKIFNNYILKRLIFFLCFILIKTIRLFYLFKKKNKGNIVILAIHKIGDSVFTVPTIKLIQNHFNMPVYIFCYEQTIPIFSYNFGSNIKYVGLSLNQFMFGNRIARRSVRKILKEISPEIIFDLTGSILTASILFNSSADKIIGVNELSFKGIYDEYYNNSGKDHLAQMYLNVLKNYVPVSEKVLEFPVRLNRQGKILIHPSAGWKAKEWNFNKFIELYQEINKKYESLFVLEKNKIDKSVLFEMKNLGINYVETGNINELIEVISGSGLLITNDTGPLHIANMTGSPTFSIFGPTNPFFHLPFGKYHRFINKKIYCSPVNDKYCILSGGRTCPCIECMNLLTTKEVFSAVDIFIHELQIMEKSN